MQACSVTGSDVLSEYEGITSPLAALESRLEVVFVPRPYSLEGLSQARIVVPVHDWSMSFALDARGGASLMEITPSARLRWVPSTGYVMGLTSSLDWTSIRGFDDGLALRIGAHAGMTMSDWSLCTGIDGLAEVGHVRGPTFRAGLARAFDSLAVMADVLLPWDRPASLRLAACIKLAATAHARVGLSSVPVTVECAFRFGVTPDSHMLIDVRHVEPLGIRSSLTFAVEIP